MMRRWPRSRIISRTPQGKGAKVLTGGERHPLGRQLLQAHRARGNVTPQMKVAREETFGPLAPVFRFKDQAEVIHNGQ